MTTAKTWASSDYYYFFFLGGGRMFNVQGAELGHLQYIAHLVCSSKGAMSIPTNASIKEEYY
jgi:hypothetical protein